MARATRDEAQFLQPFYRIFSSHKVKGFVTIDGATFSCALRQRDLNHLNEDRERRRVLLHFDFCSKPGTVYKVTLEVNGSKFFDVPLKTLNVSENVTTIPNTFFIIGCAMPEDLRLRVLLVDKTEELGLLGCHAGGGYGIHDVSTVRALAALVDNKKNQDAIVDSVVVSLNCPLKRARLVVPCRGVDCKHLQCFDALAYLRLNEATVRPLWRCPVCDRDVSVQELCLDLFTRELLQRVAKTCDAVRFFGDGRWTPVDRRPVDVIWIQDSPARPLRPLGVRH